MARYRCQCGALRRVTSFTVDGWQELIKHVNADPCGRCGSVEEPAIEGDPWDDGDLAVSA